MKKNYKKMLCQESIISHSDDDFAVMAVVYSCVYDQTKQMVPQFIIRYN